MSFSFLKLICCDYSVIVYLLLKPGLLRVTRILSFQFLVTPCRRDCAAGKGGGVCAYVCNKIVCSILTPGNDSRQGDPELVSRGGAAHVERPSPPLPTPIPPLPPSPVPSRPSTPFPIFLLPPSLLFPLPLLPPFPFPALPLKRGVRGSSPENFEILDCCSSRCSRTTWSCV